MVADLLSKSSMQSLGLIERVRSAHLHTIEYLLLLEEVIKVVILDGAAAHSAVYGVEFLDNGTARR